MKLSLLLAAFTATVAMAAPGAVSLKRSTLIFVRDGITIAKPCVECPCSDGDWTSCRCIPLGCCCEDDE